MLALVGGTLAVAASCSGCGGSTPDDLASRQLGEPCGRTDQCAPSDQGPVVCACAPDNAGVATCRIGSQAGRRCIRRLDGPTYCEVGSYCDRGEPDEPICKPLSGNGEPARTPCGPGLWAAGSGLPCRPFEEAPNGTNCWHSGLCASRNCLDSTCAPPSGEGERCVYEGIAPCKPGLWCTDGHVCRPKGPAGASCRNVGNAACLSNLCNNESALCVDVPEDTQICPVPFPR